MDKNSLRTCAKEKRKKLNMEYISSVLAEKLIHTEEYKNAENIMLFYPLKSEVNLLALLKDETKNFYLPRIKGNELECCPYKKGDNLCESRFHTYEPTCEACDILKIDLVIVPALACDKQNYRLGYGGGYYDRLLKGFNGIKISCIPHELLVESVFPEQHDIKMNFVICS